MKFYYSAIYVLLVMFSSAVQAQQKRSPSKETEKVIVAYVTSWGDILPDPAYVTHINYAFGHVNKTFDGVTINNEARLKRIIELKTKFPKLKVMLSIGGWKSGRFSEMASTDENRRKFADDCQRIVKTFNLDGIDIDWEYPTSSEAGISSSPEDTKNYTLLMSVIREKIGKKKLLTLASVSDAKYIDFKAIMPVVDFVNVMTYDMGTPPNHHAGLYRSEYTKNISVDEGVTAHLNAGIPADKLVLGIPFYGHGKGDVAWYIDYKDIVKLNGYTAKWDDVAKAPYLTNASGEFVCTYETPESIAIKCAYLKKRGMLGAMYWDYTADTENGDLRKAVYKGINMNLKAQSYHSDDLEIVASFGHSQPIGVSVSSGNRVFVSFPRKEPYLYGLAEIVNGKPVAYPDEAWNKKEGNDSETFLSVQDLYVDVNDQLWVLDPKPEEDKFKLVQIDLKSNKVRRIYQFEDLARNKSALNDVRVDTDKQLAYLSDPGQAAIIVLDLKTGKTRPVLQNCTQTLAVPEFGLSYNGKIMKDKNGNLFKSNVNGVALSKDNKYFYFRPINTLHLYRIETKYLANQELTSSELLREVRDLGETSVCHGMETDLKGNVYLTSSTDYSIKYFTPSGKLMTLVQDSRLIWPDSIGIGTDGYLYVSSAQVNRLPQWNDGIDKTSYPYCVYRVRLPK